MVTISSLLSAIFSAAFLVFYWVVLAIGWFIAIPVAILFVTFLLDSIKGTKYTAQFLALLRDYIPKPQPKAVCSVCEVDHEEPFPEEHKYCYACGKSLAH